MKQLDQYFKVDTDGLTIAAVILCAVQEPTNYEVRSYTGENLDIVQVQNFDSHRQAQVQFTKTCREI